MTSDRWRNVGIVVALALVVWLLPGGGDGASFVSQILGAAFIVVVVLILTRLYGQFRGEIYGLGDRWRLVLYGAVGLAIVAVAGTGRLFETGAGTLLWFVLVGGASYALVLVWRQYREYA